MECDNVHATQHKMHGFKNKFNNKVHNNLKAIIYIKSIHTYHLTIKIFDALTIATINITKDITAIVNNNIHVSY